MEAEEFIKLLTNHDLVKNKSVEELKKLSLEFPYSQPVQLLYTIRLSQSSEYLFNRQLGKTSVLTHDRSILFDLFEREEETVVAAKPVSQISTHAEDAPLEPHSPPEPEPVKREPKELLDEKDEFRLEQSVVNPEKQEIEPEKRETTDTGIEGKALDDQVSLKDKVQAILEENRRLREKYEGGSEHKTAIDERISGIREKLSKIKEKHGELGVSDSKTKADESKIVPIAGADEERNSESIQKTFESEEEYSADAFALIDEKHAIEEPEVPEELAANIAAEDLDLAETGESEPVFTIDDDIVTQSIEEVAAEEHSFVGWLQRLSEPGEEEEQMEESALENVDAASEQEEEEPYADDTPEPGEAKVSSKFELFESFVEKLPELKKKRPEAIYRREPEGDDLTEEENSLVTETLAKVYVKQKHFDKAIKAYEILRLKYPEKSGFFADRIFEIKKLRNS